MQLHVFIVVLLLLRARRRRREEWYRELHRSSSTTGTGLQTPTCGIRISNEIVYVEIGHEYRPESWAEAICVALYLYIGAKFI